MSQDTLAGFIIQASRRRRTFLHPHLLVERVEEHYRLHRLPEAHLVGQDGVSALSPGEPQPVQALQLVRVQGSPGGVDVPRLVLELDGWLAMGVNRMCLLCKIPKVSGFKPKL